MKVSDLDYHLPGELIATEPKHPSRILWSDAQGLKEITSAELFSYFKPGDVLVVNNTRVLKRRIFAGELEIVFIHSIGDRQWEVLFPAKKFHVNDVISLPQGIEMRLIKKGRPQVIELSRAVDENYFDQWGELPLPPYIQQSRGQRHTVSGDEKWYQTDWCSVPGSLASPTASLHFSKEDLSCLHNQGVKIESVTLHVGLGTFLPVKAEDLNEHPMHSERVEVNPSVMEKIKKSKMSGGKIWALGTTVARALESASAGKYSGETNLLIQPGYEWKVVDRLLTNFHQPRSTLLALVAAFAGLDTAKTAYQYAIKNRFRWLSYGDLSVWVRD